MDAAANATGIFIVNNLINGCVIAKININYSPQYSNIYVNSNVCARVIKTAGYVEYKVESKISFFTLSVPSFSVSMSNTKLEFYEDYESEPLNPPSLRLSNY